MDIEKDAYWVAFIIPLLLVVVGCSTEKLIEGKPWNRKHFYIGLDLTIYFLAACLVNIVDLTKSHVGTTGYLYTVMLITVAIVVLFFQTTVHQQWENEANGGKRQVIMLCGVSNFIGLGLLYAFVRLKIVGMI